MKYINKILIIHTSTIMGGAEYSLLDFLYNSKKNPMKIHLVLSSQFETFFKEKTNLPLQIHSIELNYLKRHQNAKYYIKEFISFISSNLRLYHLVKKQNIKAIYCNTFRSLPYCFIIKLLTSAQIICHCRDNITSNLLQYLISFCSNKCIAVSVNIKNQIPSSHKVKVIHNGININYFADSEPTGWLHKKLNLSPDIKIIGNIGQIVQWKNQLDYILVAHKLVRKKDNLHFLIIGGSVDENYFRQLQQQIASLNLTAYFTLTGHVNNIKKYISEIDILLHTAINEPFGRVIIEAAAASKPVVSYASGGPSEIIRDGETGFLVQDRDIDKMAEITFLLLNDYSSRKSIGKSAQDHVTKNFNSKDYADKIYNYLAHD